VAKEKKKEINKKIYSELSLCAAERWKLKKEEEIEEEMKQEIRGSKNQKRDWIGAFIFPPVFFVRFSQSGMNRENHALVGIKNNEEKYFFLRPPPTQKIGEV
jgi:hypothetical protein